MSGLEKGKREIAGLKEGKGEIGVMEAGKGEMIVVENGGGEMIVMENGRGDRITMENGKRRNRVFKRDFTLVVIGQIISLFGNAAVRFALPLYLLNQTGSSALYGTVMACAFIPTILLSPVGGMIADRVNKRNIMVALDFTTAGLLFGFLLLQGKVDLVLLLTLTLMLLFGIAGAYQPAVQASIPALMGQEHYMQANAVINIVSSFASLLGPVFGGVLYSVYGLRPILEAGMACFVLSAVMEIFIRIPYEKQETGGSVFKIMRRDFQESFRFISREKQVIGKGLIVICCVNLFFSALINVGLPYLITEVLPFMEAFANRLYGYAEGALAAGGIVGGVSAGILAKKLRVEKAGSLLVIAALCLFPVGLALLLAESAMAVYWILIVCCFVIMVMATVFSVQVMAFVQTETPKHLVGKVISLCMMLSMCAQPLGNAMYGFLFELCEGREAVVILAAGVVSLVVAVRARGVFAR